MLVYQRLLFAAKSPRSAKWLFLNASRAAPAAAPRFGQRHSPLLARPGKRNRSATGTATKKNRWWSPSPRHILDIFAELVWKSRWRAQNLIVKHHVPMTEWQFWRWIMLDPLFQRQCSGSSMYHTWPTFGWFSEMIWIYLDIYLDISGWSRALPWAKKSRRDAPHASLFSSLVERAIWMSARSRRIQPGAVEVPSPDHRFVDLQ